MGRRQRVDHQRYTLEYWESNPDDHEEIVHEHLSKMLKGKKEWSGWMSQLTQTVLVSKYGKAHIKLVNATIDFPCDGFQFDLPADFSGASFNEGSSFTEAQFKDETSFERATFNDVISFSDVVFDNTARFDNVVFNDDCEFLRIRFKGNVRFDEAVFNGMSEFPDSVFSSDCYFNKSSFLEDAVFSNCVFEADAYFANIIFNSDASFLEGHFKAYADFGSVLFSKDVDFTYAEFEKASRFDDSVFNGETNFYSCKFEKAATFKNTQLSATPEFNFSKFVQPPYLAHMEIPFQANEDESDIVHRHMKLKHMAIISNDHEQDLRYFGYEMRAKGLLKKTAFSHKAIIFLYFICSNFGQSLIRPIVSAVLFVGIMLLLNLFFIKPDSSFCSKDKLDERQAIAIYTISSAMPIVNISNNEKTAIRKCLFGDKVVLPLQHQLWRSLHLIPTTIFLFLFGLGVRNRFKIK